MFGGVNLFGQGWIDTVFEGRNKAYGAYELRDREAAITVRAMIIGAILFSLLVSLPLLVKKLDIGGGGEAYSSPIVLTNYTLPLDVPPVEIPVQAQPVERTSVEIKRFNPPVVANDVDDATIVSQTELKDKLAGSRDVSATDDGDIVIVNRPVDTPWVVVEGPDPKTWTAPEVDDPAKPVGGMTAFRKFIVDNLPGITLADGMTELKLELKFVVERNGALTDIVVVRHGGYPDIAARAAAVLTHPDAPKWNSAINNGRPVRMTFKLPITIVVN